MSLAFVTTMVMLMQSGWAQNVGLAVAQVPAPADVARPPNTAGATPSGVRWSVLSNPTGSGHPGPADRVTVRYTAWTTDGTTIDSTLSRGKPTVWLLERVMIGLRDGLQLMSPGEKRRLWIPWNLAHRGAPARPPGMLVFDIELLDFSAAPFVAPEDLNAPPAEALRTASGLTYRKLRAGTGTEHPAKEDSVTIRYSSWLPDGTAEPLDSSAVRGGPVTVRVDRTVPGLIEGLALMVEGDTMRFWMPEALAAGPSKWHRPIVYDVELVRITRAATHRPAR